MRILSRILFVALVVTSVSFSASPARAAVTPLAVSILAPVQFPTERFTIAGARISAFWGDHSDVYGFDLGLIGNMTDHDSVGVAVSGIFNYNKGQSTIVGLQFAGITNINVDHSRVFGVQAAAVNMNYGESTIVGLGVGLANITASTDIWGVQAGIYNTSRTVNGFQFGLVNIAQSLHGVQIGLVNINRTGLFLVAPILNVGF
jgi:hypothetical protein